jgi:TRAP-type mannitol/chloroaromatic compound transport system permease small subunit
MHMNGTLRGVLETLDRWIGVVTRLGMILVIPVSALLFLQWPLRGIVQAYSREANDLAQWLFALYVSIALVAATRDHTHLAADAYAQRFEPRTSARLSRAAALLALVPWSLFMLYAAWPGVVQSVLQWEAFPETTNPGYFLIKVSAALLAILTLLQALITTLLPSPQSPQ